MATSNSNPNPNPMKRDREKFEARPALRDRFDAKVEEMKQRGPVGTPEITRLYGDFLLDLTRNSKPLILELTAIAAKYKDHVEGIANAILDRIVEVPVERKLPSWYLLDSILKNVGDQYRLYFAGRLDTIFIETYKTLSPTLRPAMVHLFRTWGKYIPSFARDSIENFLKKDHTPASSGDLRHSGSHSPHLSRGHVNAKYLVAFHRMEHSAASGCRASGDKFQDYVVSREESMLRSQNSYHCQETLKLSNEPQERSAPFVATPVSPRLVPRNSCYVQAQGAVFSPNSSALPTEINPTNPPPQSSLHTFRPIYLPSLHPSPFSLPSAAAAPHPFPAAADAASISPVATAPLTPHPAAPTPHPAPHNFSCPSPPPPPPPPRFNPAYPLPILPPPVAPSYNSLSFTYLPSGWLPLPLSGPLPASSQTPPVPHGTNTGISESPASAFQGLLSSLLAQGFLSCPSNLSQDALIDFNPGLLKVRHESSINAMYDNLSKQCRTCGMRFISQEDLIGHMDWHMTVDRVARNQNPKSSCNWYVSAKEWLSGVEALGDDVLPGNFFHMSQ